MSSADGRFSAGIAWISVTFPARKASRMFVCAGRFTGGRTTRCLKLHKRTQIGNCQLLQIVFVCHLLRLQTEYPLDQLIGARLIHHPGPANRIQSGIRRIFGQIQATIKQLHNETLVEGRRRRRFWRHGTIGIGLDPLRRPTPHRDRIAPFCTSLLAVRFVVVVSGIVRRCNTSGSTTARQQHFRCCL